MTRRRAILRDVAYVLETAAKAIVLAAAVCAIVELAGCRAARPVTQEAYPVKVFVDPVTEQPYAPRK